MTAPLDLTGAQRPPAPTGRRTNAGTLPPASPLTHLPRQGAHDLDAAPPQPLPVLGRATSEERFVRIGSWVAGFAFAWVVTHRLLPMPGPAWLLITGFFLGLLFVSVTTAMTGSRVEIVDRLVEGLVVGGALVVGAALVSTIVFVFARGWRALVHAQFLFTDMSGVGPDAPLSQGGVLHAIVGSLVEIGIAVAITLPLGVGTAVFMTEIGGRTAKVVRTVVEAMTALPSIVAGLFIYSTLIISLGVPRSGLAASMALAVMMLPIIARASDVVLRVVPSGLREAGLALGASRWKVVWHVVLPTVRPGLATALILGVARGIGETSPVLITSGAASFTVTSPTDGAMNSLPLFIFSTVRSGVPEAIDRAFGTAAVLLALVLLLFVVARRVARPRGARPSLLTRVRRISPPRIPMNLRRPKDSRTSS